MFSQLTCMWLWWRPITSTTSPPSHLRNLNTPDTTTFKSVLKCLSLNWKFHILRFMLFFVALLNVPTSRTCIFVFTFLSVISKNEKFAPRIKYFLPLWRKMQPYLVLPHLGVRGMMLKANVLGPHPFMLCHTQSGRENLSIGAKYLNPGQEELVFLYKLDQYLFTFIFTFPET